MTNLVIRNAIAGDARKIVSLNDTVVSVTSPMDLEGYRSIGEAAALVKIAEYEGETVGFLIAFGEGSKYSNGNYEWFSKRVASFIYVDRIVIAKGVRGKGIGLKLYSELFEWSKKRQLRLVVAEIDLVPPNPGSLKFHKRIGFEEIGKRLLSNQKLVAMVSKKL